MGEIEEGSANIILRRMTPGDIPFGMELKSQAEWNQVESDWELLLAENGDNFVAELDGRDAGTVISFPYGDHFTWIAMVLVDQNARRKGIGKALLKRTLELARPKGAIRLDATEEGYELYSRLGFRIEYELVMMVRRAGTLSGQLPAIQSGESCFPMAEKNLESILELDIPIFGADRSGILRGLFKRNPEYACHLTENGAIRAYCLGRSGSQYERIGPMIADNSGHAAALLGTMLESMGNRDIVIDVFADKRAWISLLEKYGFTRERQFLRMCLGDLHHPGITEKQFAIAGPELG